MALATMSPEPAAGTRGLTTEIVEDRRAFLRLEPEWNALLQASSSDNPFLTWEWTFAWWSNLGQDGRLRLVAVRDGRDLVGIAPLVTVSAWPRPFRRTTFLGSGMAGSDYLDVIAQRGREHEIGEAVGATLVNSNHSLALDHLPPQPAAAHLKAPLERGGWTIHESVREQCPYVPLAGQTWDSYLASLGSAHRANVRRRLRALERDFPVRFELVPSHERPATLDRLAWFHERRWEPRGGSTAFSTIPLRAFHAEASRRLAERGWLRLYALRLDGITVAAMYGFFYNRRFYFYQHGFDETYASYSLGLVTMALTIRAAIAEGAVEFDMLYGREGYKRLWTSSERPLLRIHAFRPGVEGAMERRALQTRRVLGSVARRLGWKGSGHAS